MNIYLPFISITHKVVGRDFVVEYIARMLNMEYLRYMVSHMIRWEKEAIAESQEAYYTIFIYYIIYNRILIVCNVTKHNNFLLFISYLYENTTSVSSMYNAPVECFQVYVYQRNHIDGNEYRIPSMENLPLNFDSYTISQIYFVGKQYKTTKTMQKDIGMFTARIITWEYSFSEQYCCFFLFLIS